VPYLSASAVAIHYEEVQYQVYVPLLLPLLLHHQATHSLVSKLTHKTGRFDVFIFSSMEFSNLSTKNKNLTLTNPQNAYRRQSRSSNMVPFDILGMVSYWCAIETFSLGYSTCN